MRRIHFLRLLFVRPHWGSLRYVARFSLPSLAGRESSPAPGFRLHLSSRRAALHTFVYPCLGLRCPLLRMALHAFLSRFGCFLPGGPLAWLTIAWFVGLLLHTLLASLLLLQWVMAFSCVST